MRSGHKARLGRLSAGLDDAKAEAVDRRYMLRFEVVGCCLIRGAMLKAGVDPVSSPALSAVEERLAGFVDTPELQAADEAIRAEQGRRSPPDCEDEDSYEALVAEFDRVGRRYAESGTLPDFRNASFLTLLGWASPPASGGSDAEIDRC